MDVRPMANLRWTDTWKTESVFLWLCGGVKAMVEGFLGPLFGSTT